MNAPKRALGWAIRFFWIIAFTVAVACIYSATLVKVDLHDPIPTFFGTNLIASLPVSINNDGYFVIDNLNITTRVVDDDNSQISVGNTLVSEVSPQDTAVILHNVSFSLENIVEQEEYLFNDSNFLLLGSINLKYANILPLTVEVNKTLPWGAPLFNFRIDVSSSEMYNSSHMLVKVPVSFWNHSPILSVSGLIRIEVINNRNQRVGEGATLVDVPPGTPFVGELEALIGMRATTTGGQIHVYVETEMFNYGPAVIDFG